MFSTAWKRLRVLVAIATATVVMFAGATVAGARASTTAKGGACDSPGVTKNEIKVGLLYPQSGATFGAQFLPLGAGIRARLAAENAKGGVGGRELVAVEGDDGGDNTVNLAAARQLVDDEGVFGVIEASPSSKGPSAGFLNREGVPVTGWPINFVWGKYDNMFGYGGSTSPSPDGRQNGKVVSTTAQFFRDHGAKNLASIGINVAESANAARNQAAAFRALKGKVGYLKTDLPPQPVDYTADAQAMKDAKVDTLAGSIQQPNFTLIYQAALQAGVDFEVVYSPTGYDERLVASFGKTLAGAYFSIDFAPFELELPAHQAFDAAMAKFEPDAKPARQQLSMVGWLSADLFIRGLKEAGAKCPTREAFIKNLRKVKDFDADGLLLQPVNEKKTFGTLNLCTNFTRISADGSRFELVDDDQGTPGYQSTCGKLIKPKD